MLEGKTTIVTGAARGIGAAFARAFADRGASVVACDLRECEETVETIRAAGGRAISASIDVTDLPSCERVAEFALAQYGRIDGLMNNAAMYGNLSSGSFESIDEDEWDACMRVNVKGLWHCAKVVVPAMREQGGGSIVNIASLAAIWGIPNALHYSASKAGVIGFTRGLARELGRDNIRVNAIAPSLVDTPGTEEMVGEENLERFQGVILDQQTLRRTMQPDDLVGMASFLVSDDSAFVTGQTLNVDGGWVYR
tara:strand:+ start:440 stop:1198 length:759 start_codon:yes stop_codon:yes gene_type:complete